jgi:hypothetical protein
MKSRHVALSIILLFCLFALFSCAPAGNTTKEYGFVYGILHGFVFIFALIGKLFKVHYGLYAENNTGLFYWLGFILGLVILLGGGGRAARR